MRNVLALWPIIVTAGVLLAVLGCERPPGVDQSAATDPLKGNGPAVRVVSLSPAASVIVRDLGLASSVVGRHGYEMVLDETLPVCGDQAGIDLEAVLAASPDVVITQWGARELPPRFVQLAGKHGWRLHDANLMTLDDIRREVPALAGLVRDAGGPDAGPRSEELTAEMARAWSKRGEGFAKAGRVLLLADVSPPAALGPGSFHHQILEVLGGVPAVLTGNAYQQLTVEDVLAINPDGVVLIMPRSPRTEGTDRTVAEAMAMLGRLGALDIGAVKSRRVTVIDDPLAHTPSTAMIGLADELAERLGEWTRATRGLN